MTKAVNLVLIILVLGILCVPGVFAQTTEISYQGSLQESGSPANGNYDIEFRLFSAASGGSQIGTEIFLGTVPVANGVFSVRLDFGANGFPGQDRYLQISVRRTGVGSLVTLGPRQRIGSAPYAIQALQAATATTAMVASNAQALGGVSSSQFVVTTDPRMTDPRNPIGGSANYIQNTNSQQASSNFNVSGTGTANIFTATNRYNFGTQHALSAAGLDNIFAGSVSGILNLGNNNAFFGAKSGQENKQGSFNAFFGAYAGQNNVTGENNSFFGYFAGNATTSGNDNSFFGNRAGQVNTSGAFNSFFGTFSGFFNATGSDNSFFGNETGFNNNGNRNSYFGSKAGRENSTGSDNAFLGSFAGRANTTGSSNSFVGSNAGQANATGINNSFMGSRAGFNNTASNNSFFGTEAGHFNTTGANNTFLGRNSGRDNTAGELNVFIGTNAGIGNQLGRLNTIVGAEANVLGTNLSYATAIGAEAVVNASNTVVIGRPADTVRIPGNINILGTLAAANLSIQASTISGVVGTANGGTGLSAPGMAGRFLRSDGTNWQSLPLLAAEIPSGATNYVQNTTTQQGSTNFNISGNGTAGGTLWGNVVNSTTQYNINGNRVLSAPGLSNLFAGVSAGNGNTTGGSNSFFGNSAGVNNSSGGNNSFFGSSAGQNSSSGGNNTFAGSSAGTGNTIGANNAFFGANAGQTNTLGNNNTVLGSNANVGSNNLSYATAIGADAVVSSNNTVVLGRSVDTVRAPGNLQVDGTLTAANFSIPATNLTGTVPVANGGTGMSSPGASGNYLRSNGSIWLTSAIAAGDIPAGNTNYIQNGLAEQNAANFNIGGNGTVGGLLSANTVNSATQYNIGGTRVLSNTGSGNIFAGAGTATSGSNNSFFGFGAGDSNTTGFSNTIIGNGADVGAGNLSFATALGAGATVSNNNSVVLGRAADTVRIPGSLVLTGTLTAPSFTLPATSITGTLPAANGGTGVTSSGALGNVLRSNGTTWTSSALQASDIPSLGGTYIQNGSTQQVGAQFNVGGNGTIGGSLTVNGAINGSLAASNLTGTVAIGNGGTGLASAGTSGHFLKSTGTGFATSALTAAELPSGSTSYIHNAPGSPQTGSFNVTGNGTVGGNMNIGGNASVANNLSVTGDVTVNGDLLGTFTVPAANITGTLGVARGGTGLASAGTSGHFLKSTGSGFATSALTAAELPAGSTNYIQSSPGSPQAGGFNVAGSGTVGTNLSVGQNASVGGSMTVTGGLTVNGAFTGSFTVQGSNITGTVAAANGGTGLAGSSGTGFLRGNGSGGWAQAGLVAADIPSLGGTYIQNAPGSPQSGSFNVNGSGEVGTTMTVGTTLNANTVNATTQYNIGGNRVLANNASGTLSVGEGAGNTGGSNVFVGTDAGNTNAAAGSGNTIVGANADVSAGNLNNATAIGANAQVTQSNSVVIGGITGVNGGSDTTVGIGTTAPKAKLDVRNGDVYVGSPGQGFILKAPNGTTCALISLSNAGALVTTTITCP